MTGGTNEEFLWKVHEYVDEYVRYANTKAVFVVGWTSALFGYSVSNKYHHSFTKTSFSWSFEWGVTLLALLTVSCFVLLTIGFVFAILAIRPSLKRTQPKNSGLVFFEEIKEHGSWKAYEAATRSADETVRQSELTRHVYDLSTVCSDKFLAVNRAIVFASGGTVLLGITTILIG